MSAEPAPVDMNLIDVVGLKKYFPIKAGLLKRSVGAVKAVDDVNFYIKKGETLGLVGESGCGKTTVGRSILMLTPPTEGCVFLETPKTVVAKYRELSAAVRTIRKGRMTAAQALHIADLVETLFSEKSCEVAASEKKHLCSDAKKVREIASKHGGAERIKEEEDIRDLVEDALEEIGKRYCINLKRKRDVKKLRSRIQFVFQDPFSSLDPKMLIKDIVSEPLKSQARQRAAQDRASLMSSKPTSVMSQHAKRVQQWHSKLPDADKDAYLRWYLAQSADVRRMIVATDFGRRFRTGEQIKKVVPPATVPPEIAFRYHEAQTWYSKLDADDRKRIVATVYGKVRKTRKQIDDTVPPSDVPFDILMEYHRREARISRGEKIRREVIMMIEKVGLNVEHMYRFPHEFSGGQRQRIGIARALSVNPDFVVLDEPTSALDVSVQAQILNMLNQLQNDFGLTYLFISHDLSIIRYMCDRVAVMYLGKIVEYASKDELFSKPTHPYTEALLSVIPVPDPELKKDRIILPGDVPSPANPPSGCRFHTRCPLVIGICHTVDPPLTDRGNEHFVACHVR